MNAKTIRQTIEVRLFTAVLLATFAFAAAANAQTFSATFTLPFEAHWGKIVLPAGNYRITVNPLTNVALFQSADGKTAGFTPIPITASSNKGATALSVMVHRNQRLVRSLNLPGHGITLVYMPTTSAEREILAQADQVKAVPVVMAGK